MLSVYFYMNFVYFYMISIIYIYIYIYIYVYVGSPQLHGGLKPAPCKQKSLQIQISGSRELIEAYRNHICMYKIHIQKYTEIIYKHIGKSYTSIKILQQIVQNPHPGPAEGRPVDFGQFFIDFYFYI